MLATCSIDNKVIIWSIDKSRMSSMITEPLKVLSGHTSWAKGVAWDPIGKVSWRIYKSRNSLNKYAK